MKKGPGLAIGSTTKQTHNFFLKRDKLDQAHIIAGRISESRLKTQYNNNSGDSQQDRVQSRQGSRR